MACKGGGISTFADNGSRPSSSQKKKGHPSSIIRKSITISKTRKLLGTSNSPAVDRRMHKLLYTYRAQLRPLLDAIRFVESSNREDCPDGDGGASIGPLQISEHYHFDAWHSKRTFSWLCCRELEHAENTVVAYWMRYCSHALSTHDWETLAKIHNGGPQGPRREKTGYYWSKVVKYLEEQGSFPSPHKSQITESNSSIRPVFSRCSSLTNLEKKMDEKLRNAGLKISASERHKPIVSKRRKQRRRPLTDISSTMNIMSASVEVASSEFQSGGHSTSRRISELIGLGNLTVQHLGIDCSYVEIRRFEQKVDDRAEDEAGNGGTHVVDKAVTDLTIASSFTLETEELKEEELNQEDCGSPERLQRCDGLQAQFGSPIEGIVVGKAGDEFYRGSQEYWKSPESFGPRVREEGNLMMLYSTDVSAQKEEEILTELAQLLPPDLCDLKESFEFPRTALEIEDYATPVFKRRSEKETEVEEEQCAPLRSCMSFDATEPKVESEEELLLQLADLLQEETVQPATAESIGLNDFVLDIPEASTSIEYAKALFSCEDELLERLCQRVSSSEQHAQESVSSSETVLQPAAEVMDKCPKPSFSLCSCRCKEHMTSSSLKRLCTAWEEHDVDLLTRSLRFKMLTAETGPKLQMPCLAWEIQALRTTQKNPRSQGAAKELIKQQRDMIYVNIGSYASRNERNRLYSSWGIRKLATGRLKKIVFELLWKDPKRYHESAELVTKYL